ncbi:hypothetical protein JCM10449v2_008254 [Rhodotorula kratochvilovae]
MSGSDTLQLLSILRGTAPAPLPPVGAAPPPPSSAPAAAGGGPRAPSAGSVSLYETAPPTPAPPASDLSALLGAFARPHPSTAPAPRQGGPPQHGAQPQSPVEAQGGPRPPLAQGNRRSSELLSLFHGAQPHQHQQHAVYSPTKQDKGDDRVVSPTSPPGGNARQLLGLLMGGGSSSASSAAAGANAGALRAAQEGVKMAQHAAGAAAPVSSTSPAGPLNAPTPPARPASKPGPDFSFVSPFDVLAKTPVTETESPLSPGASAPPPPHPLSSVPMHVRAHSTTSGSDSSEATSAAHPHAAIAAPIAGGPITHAYLAAQYLPAAGASSRLPHWAPLGLRLPHSAHPPHEAQRLTITLAEAHAESLAPAVPPTTPITLLPLPAAFPAARRAAGIWPRGIAYATGGGKGRVRVIDRESGARVLLKGGKSGDVRELAVAPYAVSGRRRIATVTEEGVAAVWDVADAFESEEQADPHRLRDLPLPHTPVSLVRFSPNPAAQTLALVCADSTVVFVALDKHAERRQLVVEGDIADAAYSADGSTFVMLTRDGRYTLYTAESLDVAQAGTVSLPENAEADQLALLAPAEENDGAPAALAISSQQGTHIALVAVSDPADPSIIAFTAPPGTAHLWGQMAYHAPSQSLLVAHSLRGSLYAFRLAFTPPGDVRVEHVLEHPTPDPLLSFVLDALPSADPHAPAADDDANLPPGVRAAQAAKLAFGALVLHPRGLSHLGLVASPPRPPMHALPPASDAGTDDDGSEPDLAALAGRRMSLEGSIYVSSEVSVQVDEPETDELSLKVAVSASPAPSPALALALPLPSIDEPAGGDLGGGLAGARTPIAALPSADGDGIRLAGPVVNAAIRSMKARQAASASPSPPEPASAVEKEKEHRDGETVVRELRRIEAVLPGKIGKAVSRELEKHVSHLENHSASSAAATSSREDGLLAFVQETVTRDVARVVEGVVAAQVGGAVERAVRAQLGRGIEEAIARVLPVELEKQLNRPSLSFALSSSIAQTIAPPLERHLTGTLVKLVVPALEQKLAAAVDGVIGSIRMEMVGVRKEVVQEQSGAVSILEDEVANLREEVSTLKAMMEQMHALVVRQSQPRSPAAVVSPRVPHQPLSLAPPPQRHQQQRHVSQPFAAVASPPQPTHPLRQSQPASSGPAPYALPPIPRAPTPPERYEELFTEAMQPQHEPAFTALVHLIASSPLSRLDAVFPPPPGTPKITMAVVLSLAYRLAQLVAEREGPLDDEGRKQLLWLRKAIAACDGKQPPELLALIPRILTTVTEHLAARGAALVALHDHAGANELRLVLQYAHARLSLFEQVGADGAEGFETFRR